MTRPASRPGTATSSETAADRQIQLGIHQPAPAHHSSPGTPPTVQTGDENATGGYTAEPAMMPDPESEAPLHFHDTVPRAVEIRLYVSHFLSTWNSRLFEFAAVLFLASIYPHTLLPLSVYALVRNAAAILFAQSVGSLIDRADRLAVVRASIIGQRLAVAGSCALFWAMEEKRVQGRAMDGLFAVSVLLACVEKLCSLINLVAVERDWVVVITEGDEAARRVLNARIRRIDLFCKLAGPLVISTVMIASTAIAIWTTLAMNLLSVLVEMISIGQVFRRVPALSLRGDPVVPQDDPAARDSSSGLRSLFTSWAYRVLPISSLPFYFQHPAFLPSFALALLYFTVLSFSGQMITYLISVGYTSLHVGIARTVSTILELSATWVAPYLMKRIGTVRGGIWSISWQAAWLAGGIAFFFAGDNTLGTHGVAPATGLAVGVALSRVGLWGYDLCAQNIIQDEVEADFRGTFSTVEASFQNLFELLSYASTIIFSRPDQFRWPVVISVVAVYAAGGLYTAFVRKRRGHLLHMPPCLTGEKVTHRQERALA